MGGVNTYAYANNNPIGSSDASGLAPGGTSRFFFFSPDQSGTGSDVAGAIEEGAKMNADAHKCRDAFCKQRRIPYSTETLTWCLEHASGDVNNCADYCGVLARHPDFTKECRITGGCSASPPSAG